MLFVVAVRSLTRVLVVVASAALGVATGCGGRSPIEPGDGGSSGGHSGRAGQSGTAGQGSAGQSGCNNAPCTPPAGPCDMLLDEKSCAAHPECEELHCPDCKGGQAFVDCTEPDSGLMVGCGPCPTSPSCNSLDETMCKTRSDCAPAYCPDCMGGEIFWSCAVPGSGGGCPPSCPPPCGSLDEATCKTRSDCQPDYCGACGGGQNFVGCGEPGGGTACPATVCTHACGTITASDYDQSCASDADCVAEPEGDFCDTNRCTDCANAVVSVKAQAQYEADLASKIAKPIICPCPSGPIPVCDNGTCATRLPP